ncbi:R3H domain-containing nucleic acid-binding protein [Brachybacterium sp. FME24]|uniref:Jag family protein n=1 Tax=Brachybacterium sp. FME24 TaxID=2742605 RepID=UPI001D0475B0|nr:R3H domain-containing nucleic acid-binding protein [Brachybacterium sp. FME24]
MNDTTPDARTADESDEQLSAVPEPGGGEQGLAASDAPAPTSDEVVEASEADTTLEGAETVETVAPDGGDIAQVPGSDTGAEDAQVTHAGAVEVPAEDSAESDDPAESTEERMRRLEEEGDIAADYLEELLDITDLDGDIDIDVDGDRASVEIAGADRLAKLNRPKGELLDALQELTRLAVQTRTGNRSRLMLDIGGFRAEHKDSLEDLAEKAVAEAKSGDSPVPLRAMNPFERKVVHDVAKREGLRSESDGDGKNRHVVIYPES